MNKYSAINFHKESKEKTLSRFLSQTTTLTPFLSLYPNLDFCVGEEVEIIVL